MNDLFSMYYLTTILVTAAVSSLIMYLLCKRYISKSKLDFASFASKILYDLRAPMVSLQQALGEKSPLPSRLHKQLTKVLEQISKVCIKLLAKTPMSTHPKEVFSINKSIENVIALKRNFLPPHIQVHFTTQYIESTFGSRIDFEHALSSILDNSIEAIPDTKYGNIIVKLVRYDHRIMIEVIDDGVGISRQKQRQIIKRTFRKSKNKRVTNSLSRAQDVLKEMGGELVLSSSEGAGTLIKLELPYMLCTYVLIDDDPLQHLSWYERAKQKDIALHCFDSIDEFLEAHRFFAKNSKIYLSPPHTEKGRDNLTGERLAQLGYNEIYVQTHMAKIFQEKPQWIKSIITKGPPF